MAKGTGKKWEENFVEQCVSQKIEITRLHDVFQGTKSITNHCDYIVYKFPFVFHLELKSTGTGTFPLTNLSVNQYNGLMSRDNTMGVVCGLLIQYRKFEKIYFIPIKELARFKKTGVKSIKFKDIERGDIKAIELPSKIKRTNYDLDLTNFLIKIGEERWDKMIFSYSPQRHIK